MSRLSHCITVESWTPAEVYQLFQRVERYQAQPFCDRETCQEKTICILSYENSTRTRLSFEMAAQRLGAHVTTMTANTSSVTKGETLEDTIKTLSALGMDMLVLRHPDDGAAAEAAKHSRAMVINAGDGCNEHPTQALLDAYSLWKHFGRLEGLKVTICGDLLHSRVARSNTRLLAKMGVEICHVSPDHLRMEGKDAALVARHVLAMEGGIADVDAIMLLRVQRERLGDKVFDQDAFIRSYQLTEQRLALAPAHAVILHPGPVNRDVELAGSVVDSPRALILAQVAHGVVVRQALLATMLT
jgi:aspartate carbamoyltransferase catalytic subunit